MENEETSILLKKINNLINGRGIVDRYDLITVADYFEHLSINLGNEISIYNVPYNLISNFDTIYLSLLDYLEYYPTNNLEQVKEIVEKNNLGYFFSKLSILSSQKKDMSNADKLSNNILQALFRVKNQDINNGELFDVKMALNRLSQIVKYVSSKEISYIKSEYNDFSEHYNFDLIDKEKIIALISLLKIELKSKGEDNPKIKKLLDKVDAVEKEIRKKDIKINWSFVVTSLFVAYGFLADFKSLMPEEFEKAVQIAGKIIEVLHHEPQVSKKSVANPFHNDTPIKENSNNYPILPPEIRIEDEE